jgi:hypothetical protein
MRALPLAFMFVATIAACGGNNDDSSEIEPAAEATVSEPETPTTTTTVAAVVTEPEACSDGRYRLVEGEREVCENGNWVSSPFVATTTTAPPEVPPAAFSGSFISSEGWTYTIRITPTSPDPESSPGRCLDSVPPIRTNLRYVMWIENELGDRSAPWPNMAFTANLGPSGDAVDPAAVDFESSTFNNLEVFPQAGPRPCFLASVLGPTRENPATIGAGSEEEFVITIGGVADPVPDGVVLHVRFDQGGNRTEVAVPYDQ